MQTSIGQMALPLPPSPHRKSFELFYGSLVVRIKRWLNELLDQLKTERRIVFDPAVHIRQIPPFSFPEMDMEQSCRIQAGTLEKALIIWPSLDKRQAHWDWDLGNFPLMTSRGSFIYNGNEHVLIVQLSNSPGIFFSWEEKETRRNVLFKERYAVAKLCPKQGIHLDFSKKVAPRNGPFRVIFRNRETASLENYLRALGFSEEERKEIFIGAEDNIANGSEEKKGEKASDSFEKDIRLIARNLGLRRGLEEELSSGRDQNENAICGKIRKKFYSNLLGRLGRAQVNRRIRRVDPTFAGASETITKEDVAGILKSFVAFINGEGDQDDPWDLGNLKVRLVEDYLEDGTNHWFNSMGLKIRKKVEDEVRKGNRIGTMEMKDILKEANKDAPRSTLFSRLIYDRIFRSFLSHVIPKGQNNLVEAASLTRKITYSGGGGILVGHEREPRDFHWSHYGRICPLESPQSDEIGTSLSLTVGARINELGIIETACNKIRRENGNIKIEPEVCWISPWEEVEEKTGGWIAFPDQREILEKGRTDLIQVHRGQETLKTVSPSEVGYIHNNEAGMFSLAANLIPFRKHNDPTRGVMACGFFKQALPLKGPTPPRVKTGFERLIPQAAIHWKGKTSCSIFCQPEKWEI